MRVALTVADFLNRGAGVYGSRSAVIDEPDVPGSLGTVTYTELEARARGMARGLDHLGVAHGERVAIVSPELRPVPHVVLRCERLRPHPRADQLPPLFGGDRLHRRTLRGVGPPVRP